LSPPLACLDHVNSVLEEEFVGVSILSLGAVVTDDCCVTFGATLVSSRGILLPESHPTKVEILSLLAFLCCVRVGVPGRRRRVMHSVALTATAPLELPELKQQRC